MAWSPWRNWSEDMRGRIILAIIGIVSCATLAHSQTLDFQAMCATQARKAFQEWEIERTKSEKKFGGTDVSSDYQSHYNTKLKKCLILIEATSMLGDQASTSVDLSDAYERRIYASYLWISKQGKKYWEVPPSSCELIPSLRQKTSCTTREEFDDFVAQYMEE
jgi:hypothetical protein